ncbi:MAG: hypothetical protein WCA76_07610 [Candidatus Sulfotelmatobacter sp.]|jgi:hypothetical protein
MAFESELEAELEDEFEAELEDESEGELEDEMEGELEDEAGLEGEGWLGALGNIAGSLLGEAEDEYEGEDEYEDETEDEISPIRKIYPDAMMEHLGELAAESESEDEAAEHFAPLAHMAASKILPVVAKAAKLSKTLSKAGQVAKLAKAAKVAHAINKAVPHLTKSIGKVARTLHHNPATRHLLKTVPGIARRAVGSIAHKVARGGHITPRTAVRTLARQTRRVLGTPGHRAQALRRHNHLERKFHRGAGIGVGRLHGRHGWRYGRRWGVRGGAVPGVVGVRGATGVPRRGVGARVVGAPGVGGRTVRYGRAVGGQCACGAAGQAAAPSYCRCCGQVLR